jgi:hypothetical protein
MRVIVAIAFCITACVAAVEHPTAFPVEYAVKDVPKEGKIYITYTNITNKDICLSSAEWPNEHGSIDYAKDRIYILSGGKKYSISDMDGGYCIGGCRFSVKSGKELIGVFNYSDFKLPIEVFGNEKSLIFSPMASYCRPRLR